MGISVNGPSGIDTKYIIDSLVSLEQQKITRVESAKKTDQVKIDAFSKVRSLLTDIKTKASALGKNSSFDLFSTTSTDDKAVVVKGGSGAVDGQYGIKVFQLATNEKMVSTDGRINSQSTSLASQGITAGTISIAGVEIQVTDTDTITDLRSKINNATDSTGSKLPVSASVLKISDTNYRLVLTSKNSGSEGVAYQDISGSTLQGLGIITDAAGNKGNVQQVVQSDGIAAAFGGLTDSSGIIQYSGTDSNGNAVSNTFIKTAGSTFDEFLQQVNQTFHDMATVTDNSGALTLTDKNAGRSQLSMTSLTIGGVAYATSLATAGRDGGGVLSNGKNSYMSVENVMITNTTNSVSGVVSGLTFDLKNVSATTEQTVSVERDFDAIQKKFQEFIDSYNALLSYSSSATKFKDTKNKTSKDGELSGDSTLPSIVSQIRSSIKKSFDLFDSEYKTLTMFGLKTDITNGTLQVDGDAFKKAMSTNFDDMLKIFTTIGTSNNTSVNLGRATKETTEGRYELQELDAEHLQIRLQGSTEWITSEPRNGDIVAFSSGLVQGLSITAAAGVVQAGTTFTYSKGLSSLIDESITKLNDTKDGLITMRQQSLQKSIDSKDDRMLKLNDYIEKYRMRLTRQFTEMEKAMSSMQTQSNKLVSVMSGLINNK
jgi:flagellar hook-associated protein 2